MKIGIFDSGLGGLFIAKHLRADLPQYDYHYFGDTARVPYGHRSQAQIYAFLKQGVKFLFDNDCQLIIVACNTASTNALRKVQQKYLPKHYPDRRVLGVIIPTAEAALAKGYTNIGVLGTKATVRSKTFVRELKKINPRVNVTQEAAPKLVPLIEKGDLKAIDPILKTYLAKLKTAEVILLGCTHYAIIKSNVKRLAGRRAVIAQTDIISGKLKDYLRRHPEIRQKLSQHKTLVLSVTKVTADVKKRAAQWFGKKITLHKIHI